MSSAMGSREMTPSSCCRRALSLIEKWLTQKIPISTAAPMTVAIVIENGPKPISQSWPGIHWFWT